MDCSSGSHTNTDKKVPNIEVEERRNDDIKKKQSRTISDVKKEVLKQEQEEDDGLGKILEVDMFPNRYSMNFVYSFVLR